MTKKVSRIIAAIMLAAAVCFIGFAFSHPEASLPVTGAVTFVICAVYTAVMIVLFVAPFKR